MMGARVPTPRPDGSKPRYRGAITQEAARELLLVLKEKYPLNWCRNCRAIAAIRKAEGRDG